MWNFALWLLSVALIWFAVASTPVIAWIVLVRFHDERRENLRQAALTSLSEPGPRRSAWSFGTHIAHDQALAVGNDTDPFTAITSPLTSEAKAWTRRAYKARGQGR